MIKEYRKLPVVIKAMQFDGENFDEVKDFVGGAYNGKSGVSSCLIQTLEGIMIASVGDYIIQGIKGEFYPCKPDIFEKTYEEVK